MSSMSGGVSFDGLGSGVQFAEMIAEQKKMKSIQKNRLTYWKGDWQKRYDAFEELLGGISSLNDTLKGFNNINKILSKAVTSSSTGVASAKAAADAPEGTTSLEVTQLATNAVLTNSVVFSSKSAAVSPDGDTTFSYTYKGRTQNVKIPRGSSIQGMVDQINRDAKASKVNISANLVKSGSGYVFQIQGSETGVANDLSINGSTSVPNFTPKTMRSSGTALFGNENSYLGNLFGADGLKFSYGTAPSPLPPGKTAADYILDFDFPPTIKNTWQTSGTYTNGNSELTEDMNFTYDGKNYAFSATNKQTFKSTKAYGATDPITEDIGFSYNGKNYSFTADGTTTLADVQKKIKETGGKDLSTSLVDDGTGKKFLSVTANKVDVPVYTDPVPYVSETAPLTTPITFTTPNGTSLSYGVGTNLNDVAAAINNDPTAGVTAKVVKDETLGTFSLVVSENKQHDAGIQVTQGGANAKRTINEVVSEINADTATGGISAKMVQTASGMVMRVEGRDGATFAPGTNVDGSSNFGAAQRTLKDVVDEINTKANAKGLSASAFKNADGTYSLDLRANDVTSIQISPDDAANFASTGPAVNTWSKRAAQDAQYKMNGLEFAFSSTTNELKDVIPGLTVTLTDLGKTTLTTTTDTSKVTENVEAFVKGVNELLALFTSFTKFDKDKDVGEPVVAAGNESWQTAFVASQLSIQQGGTLTGNYGVQLLNSQLKGLITGMGVGFKPPQTIGGEGDAFFSLSSIGIIIDSDEGSATFGQLKVREPQTDKDGNRIAGDFRTLDEALEDDPLAVAQLLAGSGGISDMAGVRFDNTIDGKTKPGTYDMKYSVDVNGNIGDVYIGGQKAMRSDDKNNSYTLMSGPGIGLTVSITDLTEGDYSGTVRIKQGKVAQLCESLDYQLRDEPRDLGATAKRGTLKVLQANYKDIMDNIDKKIEQEEKRISQWERREKLRFSRLDSVLAQYNQRSSTLSSSLASMPAIE